MVEMFSELDSRQIRQCAGCSTGLSQKSSAESGLKIIDIQLPWCKYSITQRGQAATLCRVQLKITPKDRVVPGKSYTTGARLRRQEPARLPWLGLHGEQVGMEEGRIRGMEVF